MKRDTYKWLILHMIYECGICYHSDLLKYITYLNGGSSSNATQQYRKLEKSNLIHTYKIYKELYGDNKSYEIVRIMKEGIEELKTENKETKKYIQDTRRQKQKIGRTSNIVKIERQLLVSRGMMMFHAIGANVMGQEKPSLLHLYNTLTSPTPQNLKQDIRYRDEMSKKECQEIIQQGVYYTSQEIRNFLNKANFPVTETTFMSRIKGVYLNEHDTYFVYCRERGKDEQMYIGGREKNMLQVCMPFIQLTNTQRIVKELSKTEVTSNGEEIIKELYHNQVSAIVISNSGSFVYTSVMNRSHGRDKNVLQGKQVISAENFQDQFLNAFSPVFQKVFVTPYSVNGMEQLSLLCNDSIEEKIAYANKLFQTATQFETVQSHTMFRGKTKYSNTQAIYIPIYELKQLKEISESNQPIAIITFPEMIDTIAHAIRKEAEYYTFDYSENKTSILKQVDSQTIKQYGQSGYMLGREILEEEMRMAKIKIPSKNMNTIYYQFNKTEIEFYNAIANGEIDVQEILNYLSHMLTSEKKEKKQKRSITIKLDNSIMQNIKKAALAKNITVTKYMTNFVVNHEDEIQQDAKERARQLQANRNEWNK